MQNTVLSRRTMLKGLGTAIALPWLEAMAPITAYGRSAAKAGPRRMGFFYVPNGVIIENWTPQTEGHSFELPSILGRLGAFKDEMLVLSGLTCDKARANGDGPGDHARAMAAFLTGTQPYKTNGADIRLNISVDQVAANQMGAETRFPSLELGCEGGRQAGNCDSGYSCAYSSNLSWRSEYSPMVKETNPRLLFERLFGTGDENGDSTGAAQRKKHNKSILDFALNEAHELRDNLGRTDRRKLDEYLHSIRSIELRIQRAERRAADPDIVEIDLPEGVVKPEGIPRKDYAEHIRLMSDILVLAFLTDSTRIATYSFANEGSNRSYRHIGVREGHHDLSHHGGNEEKKAKIQKINEFHMDQFAYFLEKLKATPEGDGSVLDNSMILYGSGNSDGNRHNHDDLPIILLGRGGGTIQPGRHIRFQKETPLTNLYLSMLDRMGVHEESFGDSTGRLDGLNSAS